MPGFAHQRHKPPRELARPRELIVACTALRSIVNLSRIVRVAGCCGVTRVVTSGRPKVDPKVARDAAETVTIEARRSLLPVLAGFRSGGYRLVGLEQATGSQNLHAYAFRRRTVLVVGNERAGLAEDILAAVDDVVEIPVWGLPYSYNVATAAAMALYEYCRQFPGG
jgi:tRNA G18 (ribose-2'-O)-methylase SpoU